MHGMNVPTMSVFECLLIGVLIETFSFVRIDLISFSVSTTNAMRKTKNHNQTRRTHLKV